MLLQLLSHIDLSVTDMILAFYLAKTLQEKQRRGEDKGATGAADIEGRQAAPPPDGGSGSARDPFNGRHHSRPRSRGRQQEQQQALPSALGYGDIQLSAQSSPDRAAAAASSVCSSSDDFPPPLHHGNGAGLDLEGGLERGLLSSRHRASSLRKQQPDATSLASDREAARTANFQPAHPVLGGGVQMGAKKAAEEPGGGDGFSAAAAGEEDGAASAAEVAEAAWAMKYAFAAYGMLLYIFSKPATGCVELLCGRRCGLVVSGGGAAAAAAASVGGRRQRRLQDLRPLHSLNREATLQVRVCVPTCERWRGGEVGW